MDIAKKSQYLCRQKEIDLMKNMNIKSLGNAIKGHPTMTEGTVYSMLIICGISHFLNDMIQSIIPSIYPIIKDQYGFTFAQIGIITLIFQMTSSILQPFTGLYADKHPRPYAQSHRHVLYGSLSYDEIKEKSHDTAWRSTARDIPISFENMVLEAGVDDEDLPYLQETAEFQNVFC